MNIFFAQFPHCNNYNGGTGVQFEGKETYLGKTHFLTSFSIDPWTKNHLCPSRISKKKCFAKHPTGQSLQCFRKSFIIVILQPPYNHVLADIKILGKTCPLPKNLPYGAWHCEMLEIPVQGISFLNNDAQTFPGSRHT